VYASSRRTPEVSRPGRTMPGNGIVFHGGTYRGRCCVCEDSCDIGFVGWKAAAVVGRGRPTGHRVLCEAPPERTTSGGDDAFVGTPGLSPSPPLRHPSAPNRGHPATLASSRQGSAGPDRTDARSTIDPVYSRVEPSHGSIETAPHVGFLSSAELALAERRPVAADAWSAALVRCYNSHLIGGGLGDSLSGGSASDLPRGPNDIPSI
jgi:hypothetical protein